jgi:hypothetical protein
LNASAVTMRPIRHSDRTGDISDGEADRHRRDAAGKAGGAQ